MDVDSKLREIGIELKPAPAPVGNYLPWRLSGNMVFLSGSICMEDGELRYTGAVGGDRTLEEGYAAARLCALNQLSILKDALGGDLSRARRVVSLTGFVWGVAGFPEPQKVVNGASDLMVEVFGEAGKHSRAAVTVAGLPAASTVEIQSVFEVM